MFEEEAQAIVVRTLARFAEGDREHWRTQMSDDVVWDVTRDPIPGGRAVYHGHDGVEEFFSDWLSTWEEYEVENEEVLGAGEVVLVVFRQRGRGKGSGIPIDRQFFGVYDVRAGKIVRYRGYPTREEAQAAAGL